MNTKLVKLAKGCRSFRSFMNKIRKSGMKNTLGYTSMDLYVIFETYKDKQ